MKQSHNGYVGGVRDARFHHKHLPLPSCAMTKATAGALKIDTVTHRR